MDVCIEANRLAVLRKLVKDRVDICQDADLLDLIWKMLAE